MLYCLYRFIITFSGEESLSPPNQARTAILLFSSLDFFTEGDPFHSGLCADKVPACKVDEFIPRVASTQARYFNSVACYCSSIIKKKGLFSGLLCSDYYGFGTCEHLLLHVHTVFNTVGTQKIAYYLKIGSKQFTPVILPVSPCEKYTITDKAAVPRLLHWPRIDEQDLLCLTGKSDLSGLA